MNTAFADSRDLPFPAGKGAKRKSPPEVRSKPAQPVHVVMQIGARFYHVRPMACAESIGSSAFRLQKEDGCIYDILQSPQGAMCDCPDFTFRREGIDPGGCKHIQALVFAGMLPQPARPRNRRVSEAAAID